jgi:predicted nucleic acid-binding Zn ribbon protein
LIPLPDILTRFLKTHGMVTRMLEHSLQERWPEVVGEHIGRHTWPESIRHHKLYLLAENSVWLQQLRFLKPALLAKIKAVSDGEGITDIVLRVGSLPSPETKPSPPAVSLPPGDEGFTEQGNPDLDERLQAAVDTSVRPVADPALRERLRALFAKAAGRIL